jgi:hypothetical protein
MIKRYKMKSGRSGDPVETAALRPTAPTVRDPLAYAAVLKMIG